MRWVGWAGTGNLSARPKTPGDKRTTIKWHNDSMYSRNDADRVLTVRRPHNPHLSLSELHCERYGL
jgi:hypothetical protein